MTDIAALADRLSQAEKARHLLLIGQSAVEIREEDRLLKFATADRGSLESYIDALKAELAELTGAPSLRRRPIHLSF